MMNWLLNDKEGADLINKMLNSSEKFEDWEAITLFERMQSWIAREMGHRGEVLTEYEWNATMNEVEDEYDEYRGLIAQDAKLRFRINQIENEGNDPLETGKSYGTPHDLASLYGRNRYDKSSCRGYFYPI